MSKRCVGCMKLKEKSPVCEHCGYNEHVPNESHQLPIGTVLQGRYQIGKVLGQGGFGITYIGWDMSLETAVAIKEFYPGSIVNRDCNVTRNVACNGSHVDELFTLNRERFLREARILAKLSRVPGIVRVQNLFGANNTAYIVMEYVDGIDLKHYIRMQGRVLTVQEVLSIMRPVIHALSKVHKAELVHRDISPDNIMIQKDGSVVLLDFGAAREVANADVHKDLTRSTQTILKHGFAPIEQYRSRGNLGPWTDIYALCATMYYCLTGKVPSEAPERVIGDDNVNWRQIPGLTEQQIAVLKKGMASIPDQRVQSMKELDEALYRQKESTNFFTKTNQESNTIHVSSFDRVNTNFQKMLPDVCPSCMKKKKQHPICEHCNHDENNQNFSHQLPVGTILQNRYIVGSVQYQYDLGIVYTGWDISLKIPITIKEFYPSNLAIRDCDLSLRVNCQNKSSEKGFFSRQEFFLKESQVLSTLTHLPGIIQVYALFSENNTSYVIREYTDSTDLHQYIRTKNRKLTVDETLRIMKPVMEALNAIHETNLYHGDVSPDTILIQKNGITKLLETSTTIPINPEEDSGPIQDQPFSPLEKYKRNAFVGSHSDVYAVCAITYYCLTGKTPSSAPERILGDDNVNWDQIPGLDEKQTSILKKGMELIPEDRIQTIKELMDCLYTQRKAAVISEKKETVSAVTETKQQKKKPVWMIVAAVVVVFLSSFLLLNFFPSNSSRTTKMMEDSIGYKKGNANGMDPVFGSNIRRKQIITISFLDSTKDAPADSWDISAKHNKSILAWVVNKNYGSGDFYDLYIASDKCILAPDDCSYLFSGYINLRRINFNDRFLTDHTTNMSNMFSSCRTLYFLNISGLDTSNVTSMRQMFKGCTILDLSVTPGITESTVIKKTANASFDYSIISTTLSSNPSLFSKKTTLLSTWMNGQISGENEYPMEEIPERMPEEIPERMIEDTKPSSDYSDTIKFDVSNVIDYEEFMDKGKYVDGRPWEELFQ